MSAKSIRNIIVTLVVLAVGIKLIALIAQSLIPSGSLIPEGLKGSLDGMSTLMIIGIGVLILILIPVYLSKKSDEKNLPER